MKRFVKQVGWMALAAAVAIAVAACGGSGGSSTSGGASGSSGSGTGARSTTTSKPSTTKFKGTVNVAVVSDLTGDLSVASDIQGALAYFDQVNADGGVDGYKIVPSEYDTQSSSTQAVDAFRRAIAAKPAAVLGASFMASSALPTLAASGIPSVGDGFAAGWIDHATLFPAAGDMITHLSDVYLVVAKDYAHATKIALIGSAIDAQDQANLIKQAATAGIKIVYKNVGLSLTPTSAQFLSTAEQIKASGAQAVVQLGIEDVAALQTDLNQIGAKAKAIATDFSVPSTSQNGLIFSIPWATSYVTGNPGVDQYVASMKKFGYGSLIDTASYAPFRWGQAALLVHALQVAGPPFSHTAIVKALSETNNFTADGVLPGVSFPEFQHVGGHCQSVMEVVNGKWVSQINGKNPFVCGGPSLADPAS